MYAIGKITNQVSVSGHKIVHLAFEGWYDVPFCLSNEEEMPPEDEMPPNHHNFGLFKFDKQDQFCSWVDVSKLKD
jgi:hypothetical protein